jgi:predicted small lipoprotein YifL
MMRPLLTAALLPMLTLSLSACGQKGDLQRPKSAKSHPVPYGRSVPETTAALMKAPTQAAPQRNVELRTRSEPREDDPFNLPPEE